MHDIAHAAADAARVPHFDDVLARGQQHRSRRQGLVAGAAAAAVAAIIGVTQVVGDGNGGSPQPAPSVPTEVPSGSEPTNIPYWVDGVLHVGDTSITTELSGIDYVGGTTVVGDAELEGPSEYHLVDGEELLPIASSDHLMIPTISTDGELVVLLERGSEDTRRLIAWDVDSRSEVASVDIPTDGDDRYEFRVVGIDLDHRVFLTDEREALMWVPGEDPIPITGVDPADLGAKPWPGGLARERIRGDGGIATSLGDEFGTVDDRGRYREAGTITSSEFGTWSPDGDVFVSYAGPWGNGTLGLEYADDRETDTLDMPGPGFWMPVAWESETQLVLDIRGEQTDPDVPPPTEELARCDVAALTCTSIEEIPAGTVHWAYPPQY